MISRLVRIELESYFHDLVVWGGTVFFLLVLFLSFMGPVVVTRPGSPSSGYLSGVFLLAVSLSLVLLAIKVTARNSVEKRTRLFAQLPVSTREVSFASWGVRLLYLSIPTLAFTVLIARVADMPFARFALVTLATYLGGTTVIAAISVAMSISHLPPPISAWAKRVYIGCAIVAIASPMIGNLLLLPAARAGTIGSIGLPGLTGLLMVSSVGLVVLDVWLKDRADNYLG